MTHSFPPLYTFSYSFCVIIQVWAAGKKTQSLVTLPTAGITSVCYHAWLFLWVLGLEPKSTSVLSKHFTAGTTSTASPLFKMFFVCVVVTVFHVDWVGLTYAK